MSPWLRSLVLKWLARFTFTTSLVAKVDQDTEQKAKKLRDLHRPDKNTKPRKLIESICLLSPEWDSTFDLNVSDSNHIEEQRDMNGDLREPWSTHSRVQGQGFQKEPTATENEVHLTTNPHESNMATIVQDSKDCLCKLLVGKLEARQKTLLEHVSNMTTMLTDQEISSEKKKEWQLASSILDRSFLVFFVVGLVVSSVAIFMQIPNA